MSYNKDRKKAKEREDKAMNYEENYKREANKYFRHEMFMQIMIDNRWERVDWDDFWSWYYHSDISPEEALKHSKY